MSNDEDGLRIDGWLFNVEDMTVRHTGGGAKHMLCLTDDGVSIRLYNGIVESFFFKNGSKQKRLNMSYKDWLFTKELETVLREQNDDA